MCYETLTEPKKIKTNGSVMEKVKFAYTVGCKVGGVEASVLVNMEPN